MAARRDNPLPKPDPEFLKVAEARRQLRILMPAILQMWRDCALAPCRRARRCHRTDGACSHRWFRSLSNEERADLYKEVRRVLAEKLAEENASGHRG